jgi:SAM-dependent methyltransferase
MTEDPKVCVDINAVQIQRKYYAQTAAVYDQMHLMDQEHNLALSYIESELSRLGLSSVLDVGCGTGRGVMRLLTAGFDVKGVEPVAELLKSGVSSHNLPPERMMEGSGEALPFADQSFDAVMELGVLHHVPNPRVVVREMTRVARRAIFLSDSNRFGQGRLLWRLFKIAAWKLGVWPVLDWIRTRGRGYTISKEDGLAYSYSVYDSFAALAEWADAIYVIHTSKLTSQSWVFPAISASHGLLVAVRNPSRQTEDGAGVPRS